MKSVRLVR